MLGKIIIVTDLKPPHISKFPGIVDEVTEFVKQHGFAAQSRRRNETGYSSGVTIKQIQNHLYSTFPELKQHKISLSTIRRMFDAPDKGNNASAHYKEYVHARVGTKSNSYREPHQDAHYLFARNKMRRELTSLFPKQVSIMSVDDMSKIKVGAPAVSRYYQIKRFYPSNDTPNLCDHEFPVPGYLLDVSGYMFLENKSELSQECDGLTNASIYDTKQSSPEHFDSMVADCSAGTIFYALSRQMELHLNVKMSEVECRQAVCNEIETNLIVYKREQNINNDNFLSQVINEINLDSLQIILQAASKLF